MVIERTSATAGRLKLARVLLADDNPASRLTLQTVLEAGGYRVDAAASGAEAVGKLETKEYELVLADMEMEFPDSGLKVIAHARMMDYKPATAVLHTETIASGGQGKDVLVSPENLPEFFSQVAGLIGERATKRLAKEMRWAATA